MHLTYITGGQRSGKSIFAEKKAKETSTKPIYIATAEVKDLEMEQRVKAHKEKRGQELITFEEPLYLESSIERGMTVLLDCATLLTTNWLFECNENPVLAYEEITNQLNILFDSGAENIIIVSNEVGMGGIAPNKLTRDFTDLLGRVNKYIAEKADEVWLMISGIPIKIK